MVDSRVPLEEEAEVVTAGVSARWAQYQIIQRKQAEEALRAATLVDDLTGVYNRRGSRMLAEQHVRLVKRGGPVSLLRRAPNILRSVYRDSDIIALRR